MDSDNVQIWVQTPPAPVQHLDTLVQQPSPDHSQQKIAPDEMLLLGMMLYMEQGMALEWLMPPKEKEAEEEARPAQK